MQSTEKTIRYILFKNNQIIELHFHIDLIEKHLLTVKNEVMVTRINGRRISPAAFVATVTFPWTTLSDKISCDNAVWLETAWSKISANSTSCGRIFCVNVVSNVFVWFRTDDIILSTFRPAVKTSSRPLCKSSFPYSPGEKDLKEKRDISGRSESSIHQIIYKFIAGKYEAFSSRAKWMTHCNIYWKINYSHIIHIGCQINKWKIIQPKIQLIHPFIIHAAIYT